MGAVQDGGVFKVDGQIRFHDPREERTDFWIDSEIIATRENCRHVYT
jgi:hypothetical protein